MIGGDDEDHNHPVSISPPDSPAAPMAPPMETPEARRTGKKPVTIEKVVESVAEKAAEKVAEAKPRPVQKMRPTRGRGGSKAATSRRSQGGSVIGSTSSRSNSHEAESVAAPPPRGRGIGTATRSRPFRRGGGMVKSVSSNEGNDTGEAISTPMVAKASSKPDVSSGFVAVNTPHPPLGAGPSNWLDDYENLPLSSFPAGGGNPRPAGSPALPPPRGQTVASPGTQKRNPKRLQPQQDLPEEPVLFSLKDIRVIYGGGNPGSIIANVTQGGQQDAVVEYASYICLSPDAHFDPPGTMCDNAEMLDIDGQEDPLDSDTIYPVWRKIGKMWMYCGDYTQGARRMVPVQTWKNSSEIVRKFWAKKVQDTEWGREFLVRKGFRRHGEIKNNSVQEVLGYFALVCVSLPQVIFLAVKWGAQLNRKYNNRHITDYYIFSVDLCFPLHFIYLSSILSLTSCRPTTKKASGSLPLPLTSKPSTALLTTSWSTKLTCSTLLVFYSPPFLPSNPTASLQTRVFLSSQPAQLHLRLLKLSLLSARGNVVALKRRRRRSIRRLRWYHKGAQLLGGVRGVDEQVGIM